MADRYLGRLMDRHTARERERTEQARAEARRLAAELRTAHRTMESAGIEVHAHDRPDGRRWSYTTPERVLRAGRAGRAAAAGLRDGFDAEDLDRAPRLDCGRRRAGRKRGGLLRWLGRWWWPAADLGAQSDADERVSR